MMKNKWGRVVFVLDTTGVVKKPSDVGAMFLLTETAFIQEQPRGHVESRSLAGLPDTTVDAGMLMSWLRMCRNLLIPVGFPVLWVLGLMYRMVVALALAGIGMVVAMGFGARLSFGAMLRLTMVAMTADMWLGVVGSFLPVGLGCFGWILGHALSLGYVVYGVKVNADEQKEGRMAFPVEPGATGIAVGDGDRMFP